MTDQLLFPGMSAPPLTDGLFFALFPDPAAAARIGDLARRMRDAHALSAAPHAADRLHVSLHGIGEYPAFPADIAARAIEAAASVALPPFEIAFDRAMSFSGKPGQLPLVLRGQDGVAGGHGAADSARHRAGESRARRAAIRAASHAALRCTPRRRAGDRPGRLDRARVRACPQPARADAIYSAWQMAAARLIWRETGTTLNAHHLRLRPSCCWVASMTIKVRTRFDVETLRELAGDKVFARGEAYHRDGKVQILSIDRRRVLAQVEGTDDYRTELTGRDREIGGECSCPAFEDWGFCKHMVAAALAANAAGDGGAAPGPDPLSRIRDHLKAKSIDALVQFIVDLAERDPALFRKLDMAVAVAQADDKTLGAQLRKAIDDATRIRRFCRLSSRARLGGRRGRGARHARRSRIGHARRHSCSGLVNRAIDRIERAAEGIDNSDGHCGRLLHRARDIHLSAASAAKPELCISPAISSPAR